MIGVHAGVAAEAKGRAVVGLEIACRAMAADVQSVHGAVAVETGKTRAAFNSSRRVPVKRPWQALKARLLALRFLVKTTRTRSASGKITVEAINESSPRAEFAP